MENLKRGEFQLLINVIEKVTEKVDNKIEHDCCNNTKKSKVLHALCDFLYNKYDELYEE